MPVSEIAEPQLPPSGPTGQPQSRVGLLVALLLIGVVATVGSALAATVLFTTDQRASETTLDRGGCLTVDPGGELCFDAVAGSVTITGRGLMPDSTLTITGSGGDVVTSTVDASGVFTEQVSGVIVERSFTLDATWADGNAAVLASDVEGSQGQ